RVANARAASGRNSERWRSRWSVRQARTTKLNRSRIERDRWRARHADFRGWDPPHLHLAGFVHCQFDGKVVELNMIGGKFFAGGEAKQSNLGLDAGYLGLDAG